MKKEQGCWIFISHSSADIGKIRIIRNEFEKYGQNPLAFHLKCLNSDTQANKAELFDLIKREIKERQWFVYCESESANTSPYVRMERDYVKSFGDKLIWHIDLGLPIEEILHEVKRICCDIQVFISYAHADLSLAKGIASALKEKDYEVWEVWNDERLIVGTDWLDQVSDRISQIAKKGFFLALITKNSSAAVYSEIELAKKNGATVVVLIFDNAVSKADAATKFGVDVDYIMGFSDRPPDEDFCLVEGLITRILTGKLTRLERLNCIQTPKSKQMRLTTNDIIKLHIEQEHTPIILSCTTDQEWDFLRASAVVIDATTITYEELNGTNYVSKKYFEPIWLQEVKSKKILVINNLDSVTPKDEELTDDLPFCEYGDKHPGQASFLFLCRNTDEDDEYRTLNYGSPFYLPTYVTVIVITKKGAKHQIIEPVVSRGYSVHIE